MTTAHRPTFHAAIGGKEQGGGRYVAGVSRVHVHDLAGQLTVKRRCAHAGLAGSGQDRVVGGRRGRVASASRA